MEVYYFLMVNFHVQFGALTTSWRAISTSSGSASSGDAGGNVVRLAGIDPGGKEGHARGAQ